MKYLNSRNTAHRPFIWSSWLMTLGLAAVLLSPLASAADLILVAGAGYKKPVMKLIEIYRAKSGQAIVASFGNMQQIIAQTEASGDVSLIIGDEKYLGKLTFLGDVLPLGNGQLVIAWPKGKPAIATDGDLLQPGVTRIAHADAQKAIYGLAATEWMKSRNLFALLQPKLIQVATVPQVSAYLTAGEVDAAFINLTDAIGLRDAIGGYRSLPDGYTPIRIVAATIKGKEDQRLQNFLAFLQTAGASEVLREFGL